MKEIKMSIHDFMEVQRGNLTYADLDLDTLDKKLEKIAGEILKDPKLKRAVVVGIAYISIAVEAHAESGTSQAIAQVNHARNEIVGVLLAVALAICIIMCILEIGKALMSNRSSDISSIIMKYLAAVIGVCLCPRIFEWIGKLCGVNI
jgi:hypothetical protein